MLQEEENKKREQYNPNNLFKNADKSKNLPIEMPETNSDMALAGHKQSLLERFKNFVFKILHIRK